jgi:hypothetical protein
VTNERENEESLVSLEIPESSYMTSHSFHRENSVGRERCSDEVHTQYKVERLGLAGQLVVFHTEAQLEHSYRVQHICF